MMAQGGWENLSDKLFSPNISQQKLHWSQSPADRHNKPPPPRDQELILKCICQCKRQKRLFNFHLFVLFHCSPSSFITSCFKIGAWKQDNLIHDHYLHYNLCCSDPPIRTKQSSNGPITDLESLNLPSTGCLPSNLRQNC